MKIEITGLDRVTWNRAVAQLDDAQPPIPYTTEHAIGAPTETAVLACAAEDAGTLKTFVNVALFDPKVKVYR